MPAAAGKFVSEAGCPAGRSMIDRMDTCPSFRRNRTAGRVNCIEMCGLEVGIDDDDIRTGDTMQSTQYPFEIAAKGFRRHWRRPGKRSTYERHAIPDRRRNPRMVAYRGESISRTLRGSLGNNDIGIESEMRSMRFDGPDWQQNDRVRADSFGNLGPAQ